ncbi:RbsD/FucU domain-containing protein, partial [Pseudomonas syringae group genomosp. 7]
ERWITHEHLKVQSLKAKAIIRPGECQPYSNVPLVSGVVF